MKKHITVLVFSLAAFFCVCFAFAEQHMLSVHEVRDMLAQGKERIVVLDLRTKDEYEAGHIEGARSMNYYATNFQRQVSQLDPGAPVLLYCQKGRQSGLALRALDKLGFSRMYVLDGGIDEWVKAGLPLVRP